MKGHLPRQPCCCLSNTAASTHQPPADTRQNEPTAQSQDFQMASEKGCTVAQSEGFVVLQQTTSPRYARVSLNLCKPTPIPSPMPHNKEFLKQGDVYRVSRLYAYSALLPSSPFLMMVPTDGPLSGLPAESDDGMMPRHSCGGAGTGHRYQHANHLFAGDVHLLVCCCACLWVLHWSCRCPVHCVRAALALLTAAAMPSALYRRLRCRRVASENLASVAACFFRYASRRLAAAAFSFLVLILATV